MTGSLCTSYTGKSKHTSIFLPHSLLHFIVRSIDVITRTKNTSLLWKDTHYKSVYEWQEGMNSFFASLNTQVCEKNQHALTFGSDQSVQKETQLSNRETLRHRTPALPSVLLLNCPLHHPSPFHPRDTFPCLSGPSRTLPRQSLWWWMCRRHCLSLLSPWNLTWKQFASESGK